MGLFRADVLIQATPKEHLRSVQIARAAEQARAEGVWGDSTPIKRNGCLHGKHGIGKKRHAPTHTKANARDRLPLGPSVSAQPFIGGADVGSAYEWLRADTGTQGQPIACIGFCMGGRVTFLTNAVLPVKAAISFYGGGIAPNPFGPGLLSRAGDLHAPQMFFWGGLDKHIGPEQTHAVTESLRAAGKPFVNVEFSDADHGFFCDARSSYNPSAARQAWALTLTFLNIYARM